MKRAGNELLKFLAGLAMLIAGLFIFSQKVMVSSGFFGQGFSIGRLHMGNGLIMVPFIIGIVWMFVTEGSVGSKLFTAASILIVILAVIITTDIRLMHVTLYEWALILVLIFGGAGLVARILFAGTRIPGSEERREDPRIEETDRKVREIEEELERIKKER